MLKTSLTVAAAFALAVPALLSSPAAPVQKPSVGETAPDVDAAVWFNHIGKAPSLETLAGHAILVEFWATT